MNKLYAYSELPNKQAGKNKQVRREDLTWYSTLRHSICMFTDRFSTVITRNVDLLHNRFVDISRITGIIKGGPVHKHGPGFKEFPVQVNLCQKLFFWQNMGRTCCVQKLFWMSETISVHDMFSPGLSLEFSCIELVIQWTICRHIVG